MRFLIVTGMSGAGKTLAIRYLEDLGALCVDNLPPMLLIPFLKAFEGAQKPQLVAVAADIRSGDFFDAHGVTQIIDEARSVGFEVETLFMDASDETLMNRYKETRREHPLSCEGYSLREAISEERIRTMPLRETATHLIDTTALRVRTLQKKLSDIVLSVNAQPKLTVNVMSFGFKRGLPREADLVLDVRFLPNPFYIPELGHHTGLDEDVKRFVLDHPVTQQFLSKTEDLIAFLLPNYIAEGKHRLDIAIGCTGGAHRSVAIAEYLTQALTQMGYTAGVSHRDITLEQAHWNALSEHEEP